MFNLNFSSPAVLLSFVPLALWTFFAILLVLFNSKNTKVIQSLPSGFTATGVLGTFIGIFLGLQNFEVDDIQGSISVLLEGLKSSFSTSIIGIVFSIFSGLLVNIFQKREESKEQSLPELLERLSLVLEQLADPEKEDINSGLLMKIEGHFATANLSIKNWRVEAERNHEAIKDLLSSVQGNTERTPAMLGQILEKLDGSDKEDSTYGLLKELEQNFNQFAVSFRSLQESSMDKQDRAIESLKSIDDALQPLPGKMDENTLKLENSIRTNLEKINNTISESNRELSEKIAEMNSKGLLEAMEQSIETFNSKMEEMLARLVQENFQALNQSVQQLNTWQEENKTIVDDLLSKITIVLNTNQMTSQELSSTATAIHENLASARDELGNSANALANLVSENGKLQLILNELEEVALGDNNFRALIESSANSVEQLRRAVDGQRELNQDLITRFSNLQVTLVSVIENLQALASLGDVNDVYWNGIRSSMEDMLGVLNNATDQMSSALLDIDESFRQNLAGVFSNLDILIQNFMQNHSENAQPRR